jgi:CubicO group peptidase (beta-lactamase class C family)
MNRLRGSFITLGLLIVGCAAARVASTQSIGTEDWSGFGALENVLRWTPEQQLRAYPNMEKIYPTRLIPASWTPYPLPARPVDESGMTYRLDGKVFDIDLFIERNHVVGLLVIKSGDAVVERYAHGITAATTWYSFSIAKSVVSLLIGAAMKDGYVDWLDRSVSDYLPLLTDSGYDGVSIRNAMQMASGVEWNEDYTDPASDVASTGGDALARLRYLRLKPRVAEPGAVFNYSTGETNLLGAVLRSAIGNNLSTYLHAKIWDPFGMEHDAQWLLLAPGGAEHGGCCLSATLRDYGRIGLFALRRGRLADGTDVLPHDWMTESTEPSADNEGYGYLWWLGRERIYSARGIFGQAISINPAEELIIVTLGVWPRATDRELSRHRAAFVAAVTKALSTH